MTPCNERVYRKFQRQKMILASSSIDYYDMGGFLFFKLYDMIQLESFAAALLRG